MPWLELRLERLVVFERAYDLAVDEDLERAAPEFNAEAFTRQPERCWHPFLCLLCGCS
jgi:hypothetical protein